MSANPRRNRIRKPLKRPPGYIVWTSMKARCHNPNNAAYPRYGGKGLFVCDRWRNSFATFIEDMGPPPPGLTIERIDNDKGYSPENCRWATPLEQAQNQRHTILVEIDGITKSVSMWAREYGLHQSTLGRRLASGMTPAEALAKGRQRERRQTPFSHDEIATMAAMWMSGSQIKEIAPAFQVNRNLASRLIKSHLSLAAKGER